MIVTDLQSGCLSLLDWDIVVMATGNGIHWTTSGKVG